MEKRNKIGLDVKNFSRMKKKCVIMVIFSFFCLLKFFSDMTVTLKDHRRNKRSIGHDSVQPKGDIFSMYRQASKRQNFETVFAIFQLSFKMITKIF